MSWFFPPEDTPPWGLAQCPVRGSSREPLALGPVDLANITAFKDFFHLLTWCYPNPDEVWKLRVQEQTQMNYVLLDDSFEEQEAGFS